MRGGGHHRHFDVLVMKGDKIGAVYVFPDSPKK
jgi:hypothetical protein